MFSDLDISILIPGLPCDGEALEEKSLGGSESAGIYMAKALAREGARVMVFCNTSQTSTDGEGVRYLPAGSWKVYAKGTPHDVCIVQRTPEAFAQRTNARLNLLWCHDLALGRQEHSFRGVAWNVDKTIVLSRFMLEQYKEVYQLEDDSLFLSRNGVDLEAFRQARGQGVQRHRRKLIYSARPERGLDVLLRDIMPRLIARDPELTLYVAGYENSVPEWEPFLRECGQLASALGDRVVRLGSLAKSDLYREYLSAAVYVYPTPSPALKNFREVSCITAMECQAAGLPIVTSDLGALSETIADGAGVVIRGDPSHPSARMDYVDAFVERVLALVGDQAVWTRASARGQAHADRLDWSGVARDWLIEIERMLRAGNDSAERVVRHFWRNSDIVAAKHVLDRTERQQGRLADAQSLGALLSPWAFMDEPAGYRRQYETIGATHDDYVYETAPTEPRFEVLQRWLEDRKGIDSVLDYGCAHGAYAIGLAKRHPHIRIHGVDIDRFSIDMATRWAAHLGVANRATFSVWTHDTAEPLTIAQTSDRRVFNCALLQEVLEHVPEPWTVLQRVECEVKRGGKVYLTVPFGPWEYTSYRTYPHRCHIWHFDAHDIRDMVGEKPDLEIDSLYVGDNPLTGAAQGWWIVSYTADHLPVGKIDLDRHLWLQRPRQSLSAAIIAGASCEETLHWTLRSIQDVADEIVIADCGMSEEARRIAGQYGVRLVAGVDPRRAGFETARNIALEACTCDWCLWIDTDERLVGAQIIEKYLRENALHAYGVRQHNFACDAAFRPDIPVRLFRRRPHKGRSLRFWGAIHEHPEFAVNDGVGPALALRDVHVAHVGYLGEAGRQERFVRNMPLLKLDQQRYPHRLLQKYFLMRENVHLVRLALAQSGGLVDEGVRAKCNETIELYRTHFLGKAPPSNCDALPLYSEALEVLGEGFEAAFQVEADKREAKPNGVQRFRFASTEDLKAELARKASEQAQRFDSRWW
jgi:glycosyltransferase involved in cell wall biosynthesis/2-polyprenyl-3-methyl-5-hydroxy-6-metoxy-1,4-benzoquinol methylase